MVTSPVRVLVVDDDPAVRRTLSAILGDREGVAVVAEAGDGRAALEQARTRMLDVVLLDIRMPVLDGLEVLEVLRRERNPVRVVVLTTFGDAEHVRRAVALGADGFLLKADDPRDLLRAVRGTAAGEAWLSPAVARMVTDEVRRGLADRAGRTAAGHRLAGLSARERDVAELVAEGRTNAEIAAALHLGESTVKAYVSSGMDRLGVRNRVELAAVVWRAGRDDTP